MNIDFDKLARELMQHGQIIEAGWQKARITTLAPSVPESLAEELRKSFFAGAQHLFANVMQLILRAPDLTNRDVELLMQIHVELDQFIKEFSLRHMPAGGRA